MGISKNSRIPFVRRTRHGMRLNATAYKLLAQNKAEWVMLRKETNGNIVLIPVEIPNIISIRRIVDDAGQYHIVFAVKDFNDYAINRNYKVVWNDVKEQLEITKEEVPFFGRER